MKSFTPYLIFDGNCRDAMRFYEKVFGGTLNMMPFSEAPAGTVTPEGKERIMHANLVAGACTLMASDNQPKMTHTVGDNAFISIDCATDAEVDKLFNALSENGKVKMAPQDTFWGARFAMCADRFGINWMFNHDKKK